MAQLRVIKGAAVSPGLALGPVQVVQATQDRVPIWSIPEAEVGQELARLREAVELAKSEFRARQEIVAREAGTKESEIFAMHRMVLQDPAAGREIEARIENERINAEGALQASSSSSS